MEQIITSSILIAAILLLRRLLQGKISRRLQYALWLIVAVRLLVPVSFSFPSQASVLNAVDTAQAQSFLSQQVIRIAPETEPAAQINQAEQSSTAVEEGKNVGQLLFTVWAFGAVVVGSIFLGANAAFYKKLKAKRRPVAVERSSLPVYLAEELSSPCLFGLVRPAIYLTPKAMQGERLNHVIAHEYCHYRQGDHIWSAVRLICLIVYWFNPLVWAAAFCSRTDCELACDERAVQYLGENQKEAYGKTLVDLVQKKQQLSALACTATTMSIGSKGLKKRITMILHSPKTSVLMVAIVGLSLCILVSCTFTGKQITAAQAVEQLKESITGNGSSVTFTIPKEYQKAEDWNLLIYGTAVAEEGQSSIRLLEGEQWQPGKTYTIKLQDNYSALYLDIAINGNDAPAETVDLLAIVGVQAAELRQPVVPQGYQTVYITFPAYQDGRTEHNGSIFETVPFDARLALPQNWRVVAPPKEERGQGPLWTALQIYHEDILVGKIGFNIYSRVEEEVAPEQYYQVVYPELRLPRVCHWEDYTPVRTTQQGENALATVYYIEPDLPENKGKPWAELPEKQVPGVLSYNDELMVYVALQFTPEAAVSPETLQTIAQSIELLPSEYGASGKRYGEPYAEKDYSKIAVTDSEGNDVSKILIDLWYCASDAYNVDGMVVFETGEWTSLQDKDPMFVELLDYEKVMPQIFTANGILQYESSDVVQIQKTPEGRVYRLAPWRTGYGYDYAMTNIEGKEVTENKIVASVTYEKDPGYAGAYEDPSYVPEYGTTEFVVVKQNGKWLVESYNYPGMERFGQ